MQTRQECYGRPCKKNIHCQKVTRDYRTAKDQVILMLTTNTSGTCKMKPLVIYHARKPRPSRNNDMTKLNNKKAWMSSTLSLEWFDYCFMPDAEKFCIKKKIPFKILLLLDSVPDHLKLLIGRHPSISVEFTPPNITTLLQPLDQEIIARKSFAVLDAATFV